MSKPFLALVTDEEAPQTKEAQRASAIAELFELARRGEVPRERSLLPHEPALLNERHLQAIMFRCMGMKQKDIAQNLGYTDSTVSIVLNHPDAKYIIDRLQAFSGIDVTDIDARLKRLTPRAVDAIEDVCNDDATDAKLLMAKIQKGRMGFALLEHAGHGPRKQIDVKHDHAFSIAPAAASLISRALRESSEIEEAEYEIQAPGGGVEGFGPPNALPSGTEAPPLGVPQELFSPDSKAN